MDCDRLIVSLIDFKKRLKRVIMNLQHLRYFLTLAELEHYTKTARQLHITQPTLSHAIAMLESELDVSLFKKEGRNIKLTRQGKLFQQKIQTALAIIDESVAELTSANQVTFNIALLRTLSHHVVPNLLRDFINEYPEMPSHFILHNDSGMSNDMINGLINKKYNLAFCSKIDHYDNVTYVPIAVQDLVLIVPKNHPLKELRNITLNDTLLYPQIWFSNRSGVRPILERVFRKNRSQVDIAFEVEEDETIVGLVAKNFGIAIVPRMDFLNTIDIDIIEMEQLKHQRIYYMAYLNDIYQQPILKQFIDFVAIHANINNLKSS